MVNMFRPGKKLGIMGGTFNPIHVAHLRAAEEIYEYFKLEQIHFVPAAQPPHKEPDPSVNYWHRLEMLKLAVSTRPGFWASDLESQLPFPSYTINTLKTFKNYWGPKAEIFFLVGVDAFLSIDQWFEYAKLFKLASFIVFDRMGAEASPEEVLNVIQKALGLGIKWSEKKEAFIGKDILPIYYRPSCKLEISSTDLRNRLELGTSVRYLVPEAVRLYIEANGLYLPENN